MDLKRRYHWVLEPYSYASPERLIGAHPRTRGDTPSALPRSTARTREPPERPWNRGRGLNALWRWQRLLGA
jgi:hypothetical protein